MITESKVTEIFVMADDFCKFFYQMMEKFVDSQLTLFYNSSNSR